MMFWLKEAQSKIHSEIKSKKYIKLQPTLSNGIIYVGGRTERWMEATWNKQKFILLPKEHRISYLIALYKHKECGHLASDSTVAFIRAEYWIIGVKKPSPAFLNVGVDYFGPYIIKGEVQQRVRGKAYGVIFTCLTSRAVFISCEIFIHDQIRFSFSMTHCFI